jgi:hypothetical protein
MTPEQRKTIECYLAECAELKRHLPYTGYRKIDDAVRALLAAHNQLIRALVPFAEAHRKGEEPIGDSDLYDEQPRSYHVDLGAWRRAARLVPKSTVTP